MRFDGLVCQYLGFLDASNHEIPELTAFAVKAAHMPAQAVVDERVGHYHSVAGARQGLVANANRALQVDCPSHTRQDLQRRLGQARGLHAGHARYPVTWLAIGEPLREPRQNPVRGKRK
ncbi:hypothetical protein D9M68_975780 [compost metagenome]